jgi:hypothetical protein
MTATDRSDRGDIQKERISLPKYPTEYRSLFIPGEFLRTDVFLRDS